MPRRKAIPQRAVDPPEDPPAPERTYEERIGRALRDLYPDNSIDAYGPRFMQPGANGPATDQKRYDSYTAHQRLLADSYHQDYVRRRIVDAFGPDESDDISYMGPGRQLRHQYYDNWQQFVDEWTAPSAVYSRRHQLDIHGFAGVHPPGPVVPEPSRSSRPKRERSPAAGGD